MPRSTWFKALLLLVALWAPLSQAETGWQPIQETIRKSDKDVVSFALLILVLLVMPTGILGRPEVEKV